MADIPTHRHLPSASEEIHDVCIVGAGVVGCALALHLTLEGRRVVVLERGADLLSGASRANSAILHTGFDAPEGTLEAELVARGHAAYLGLAERYGLSVLRTGALVVAWSEEQLARLGDLEAQARANGVGDVTRLDAAEVARLEPHLAAGQHGALHVPREYVIDPWSPFHLFADEAARLGATFRFDAEVTAGRFDGKAWTLTHRAGRTRAAQVVNCAGLFGDRLEAACLGDSHFAIRPRKGQFVVFDKAASGLVGNVILPVPSATTKGVVITRTAFGNVLVGPTAEEQEDRTRATTDAATLRALIETAGAIVPGLGDMPVTATYAGLRPASDGKAYRIRHLPERGWLTLGGIRSTGMTASLGLAEYAAGLLGGSERLAEHVPTHRPHRLTETAPRDWEESGYGEIVCHCEMVTRREIEAALDAPVPPRSFAGLKRRTRACMGRCQGFNCLARLAEITDGRLAHPLPGTAAAA